MNKPAKTDKPFMRRFFEEKRKILIEKNNRKHDMDLELQSRLLMSAEYRSAKTILIYAARENEIATSGIIHAAFANHKTVALPVCHKGGVMTFHRITSLSQLEPGRFGIPEPVEGCEEVIPDSDTMCVCPALCCDMRGYRLGWGGGFYDRYLAKYNCLKAALCYSDALIPSFEVDEYDVKMDLICTEKYLRHIGKDK